MTKHKDEPKAPAEVPETERYPVEVNEGVEDAEVCPPDHPHPDDPVVEAEIAEHDPDPVNPNTVGGGVPFVADTRTIAEQLAALTPGVG